MGKTLIFQNPLLEWFAAHFGAWVGMAALVSEKWQDFSFGTKMWQPWQVFEFP
jgi:hypothetical protein